MIKYLGSWMVNKYKYIKNRINNLCINIGMETGSRSRTKYMGK